MSKVAWMPLNKKNFLRNLKKWEGFEGFSCIKIRKIENISELFRDSLF